MLDLSIGMSEEVQRLIDLSRGGLTHVNLGIVEKDLYRIFPFQSYPTLNRRFEKITRLTINRSILGSNQRLTDPSYLGAPPEKFINNYGRANYPNNSVFYGTFDRLTILNELKPQIGDLITITEWVPKDPTFEMVCCAIFKNWELYNGSINVEMRIIADDYEEALKRFSIVQATQVDLLNQFVADEFTKPVDRVNSSNYFFSAYFAKRIFEEMRDMDGRRIDAILYPSVAMRGSFNNIAAQPNTIYKNYEISKVSDCVIVQVPSLESKGHFMHGIGETNYPAILDDRINWKETYFQPAEDLKYFVEEFDIKLF